MATTKDTKKDAAGTRSKGPDGDLGAAEVQERVDEAEEQGFLGVKVDPTPNENYSMQTPPDAPTPETDADAAAKAREATGIGAGPLGKGGEK